MLIFYWKQVSFSSQSSALGQTSFITDKLNLIENTVKLIGRELGNSKCRKTLSTVRNREQVLPIAVVSGPWASKLGLGLIGRGYDASPRRVEELNARSPQSRGGVAVSFMAGGPLDQGPKRVERGSPLPTTSTVTARRSVWRRIKSGRLSTVSYGLCCGRK